MKKLLYIFIALIGLLLIGLAVVVMRIDPILQELKPKITKQASETLGTNVEIGDIGSSIFPTLGVSVGDVKVGSQVSAELVSVKTSIAGLISGNINVEDITLKGVNLPLRREKDGSLFAGDISLTPKAQPEVKQEKVSTEAPQESKKKARNVQIKSVGLENINVSFDDKLAGSNVEIKNIGGRISDIDSAGKANLDVHANLFSGDLAVSGVAGNFAAGQPLDLSTSLTNIDIGSLVKTARAYTSVPKELKVSKTIDLKQKLKAIPLAFETTIELDASDLALAYGEFLDKPSSYPLTVDFEGTLPAVPSKGRTLLKSFNIGVGDSTIKGSGSLSQQANISLKDTRLDLSSLAAIALPLKNFKPSGIILANLDIEGQSLQGSVKLDGLGAENPVPVSSLSGVLNFNGRAVKSENLKLNLAGNKIDVAIDAKSYMPASAMAEIKAANFDASPFNVQNTILNNLIINVNFKQITDELVSKVSFDSGKGQNIPLGKSVIDIVKKGNTATVKSEQLGVASGTLKLDALARLAGDKAIKLKLGGSGVSLAELPQKFIDGTVSNISLDISGQNTGDAKNTLSGPVALEVKDGEIIGVNVLAQVLGALSQIPGVSASLKVDPELLSAKGTAFDTMVVNASLAKGGNVNIERTAINHSAYKLQATGSAKLTGDLNLKASFSITESLVKPLVLKEPKLKLLQDDNGAIVVPVLIKKAGDKTQVLPDIEDLLRRAAKNTAKESLRRELDKVAPGVLDLF